MASAPFSSDDPAPVLDLCGLKCPMPVLRTRKALRRMAAGDRMVVLCTDPLAVIDIPHLLREGGDTLEGQSETAAVLRFLVRKGAPAL